MLSYELKSQISSISPERIDGLLLEHKLSAQDLAELLDEVSNTFGVKPAVATAIASRAFDTADYRAKNAVERALTKFVSNKNLDALSGFLTHNAVEGKILAGLLEKAAGEFPIDSAIATFIASRVIDTSDYSAKSAIERALGKFISDDKVAPLEAFLAHNTLDGKLLAGFLEKSSNAFPINLTIATLLASRPIETSDHSAKSLIERALSKFISDGKVAPLEAFLAHNTLDGTILAKLLEKSSNTFPINPAVATLVASRPIKTTDYSAKDVIERALNNFAGGKHKDILDAFADANPDFQSKALSYRTTLMAERAQAQAQVTVNHVKALAAAAPAEKALNGATTIGTAEIDKLASAVYYITDFDSANGLDDVRHFVEANKGKTFENERVAAKFREQFTKIVKRSTRTSNDGKSLEAANLLLEIGGAALVSADSYAILRACYPVKEGDRPSYARLNLASKMLQLTVDAKSDKSRQAVLDDFLKQACADSHSGYAYLLGQNANPAVDNYTALKASAKIDWEQVPQGVALQKCLTSLKDDKSDAKVAAIGEILNTSIRNKTEKVTVIALDALKEMDLEPLAMRRLMHSAALSAIQSRNNDMLEKILPLHTDHGRENYELYRNALSLKVQGKESLRLLSQSSSAVPPAEENVTGATRPHTPSIGASIPIRKKIF